MRRTSSSSGSARLTGSRLPPGRGDARRQLPRRLDGNDGWSDALAQAIATPGLAVLELRTDRERNVELHRSVLRHAHEAVRGALRAGAEVSG